MGIQYHFDTIAADQHFCFVYNSIRSYTNISSPKGISDRKFSFEIARNRNGKELLFVFQWLQTQAEGNT